MDGSSLEPVRILTHFESDYGAAAKVAMKVGLACTTLVPDFASRRWVGFEGTILAHLLAYGDHIRECGCALKKLGVEFRNVSNA